MKPLLFVLGIVAMYFLSEAFLHSYLYPLNPKLGLSGYRAPNDDPLGGIGVIRGKHLENTSVVAWSLLGGLFMVLDRQQHQDK